MPRVILIILACVVGIPAFLYLFWFVHCFLERICVKHALEFCRKRGLEITRVRWQMELVPCDNRVVKTEYTLVQLDCLDAQKQRRLVLIRAWPLGVRNLVSDEPYPNSYDEQWPQEPASARS